MVGGICVKYFTFCFNIFIMIGGALLFSTGIAGISISGVKTKDEIFVEETVSGNTIGTVLIILGIIGVFIAVLGCCGTVKENKYLLIIYVTLLVLITLAMLMLSVAQLVESKHAQLTVPVVLQLRYLQDEKNFHEDFEEKYQCCGLDGPNWYAEEKLPSSCCVKTISECTVVNAFAGCMDVVTNDVVDASLIMGHTALMVALFMVIGIITSAYILWKVREDGIAGEEIVFSYKDFRKISMYGPTNTNDV